MKRPRRSWTPEQKATIVAEVRHRTAKGERLSHVARALEIHESTVRQWLDRSTEPSLRAVEIVDDSQVPARAGSSISMATPDGFLFDGLDLSSALRLWERIR